jgi:hypothetical protein
VPGITFHRLDQVGNEVVPLFRLHVDVGERLIDPLAHGDEAVVDRDDPQPEHDDHADDDPDDGGGRHEIAPRKVYRRRNLWCGRGEGKRRGVAQRNAPARKSLPERRGMIAGEAFLL